MYCIKIFSASGHVRWRHDDVIKFPCLFLCIFPIIIFLKIMSFIDTTDLKPLNKGRNELCRPFGVDWCITWPIFSNSKILNLTWTGYDNDVIGHDRKLKKSYHSTNLLNNRLQKELGRYLFPVFLEKRKSKPHLKKYPPKRPQGFI